MDVSFHDEIDSLKLGDGQLFHGEGILAVTKALLQSGVSYVGGYPGAPVPHLLAARPSLQMIVKRVEKGFELSEASNSPVIMELRIRACHLQGSFVARDNRSPAISTRKFLAGAAEFDYERLSHPPATFRQEKLKADGRR